MGFCQFERASELPFAHVARQLRLAALFDNPRGVAGFAENSHAGGVEVDLDSLFAKQGHFHGQCDEFSVDIIGSVGGIYFFSGVFLELDEFFRR